MNKAIETMMQEHRLIEQVLGALETFAEQARRNSSARREDLANFATFFRSFADRLHHGKEEERLFTRMIEHGFPRDQGPVGVMLFEHAEGRSHVRALAELGSQAGPLTGVELGQALDHALAFVPLLRGHIQKEDNVLYPMAQQVLPREELARLNESCEAFDRETMGAAEIQELRHLATTLISAYPPTAPTMPCPAGCCH